MRALLVLVLVVVVGSCGPATPPSIVADRAVRRLPPAPVLDPDAPNAAYLTSVALQLQPGWGQFLEDCRLRLPASHALNQFGLAATAELAIDARGQVADVRIVSSGNTDFDRAVKQVIEEVSPLPKPPRELWSDDDRVHLRWLFARDRRQAGPATASVVPVELPLGSVVERLIAQRDLARAARRILRAPAHAQREAAAQRVMVAALREALTSSEGPVRRAAVDAVNLAGVHELRAAIEDLVSSTNDVDLRLAALEHTLGAPEVLLDQLRADLKTNARLALAETRVLVAKQQGSAAAAIIRAELAANLATPNPIALQALALAPVAELAPKLATWFRLDARTRSSVCTAATGYAPAVAWPLISRGVRDRDAIVRASCADAAARVRNEGATPPGRAAALASLRTLARDRDRAVRARALVAIARLDPSRMIHAREDRAGEVRAAYATALAIAQPSDAEARLRALLDDRDPDVRAAAWTGFQGVSTAVAEREKLAAHAAHDTAPQVRRAAIPAIHDDKRLLQIANQDDAPEIRTAAMIQLARIATRDSLEEFLLDRLAAATPASAERVRTALAYLLAR